MPLLLGGDEADRDDGSRSASRCTRRSCSSLARLATKDCAACIDKLDKQIERDEKAVRIPGARDLLGETRVTLAIIQNQRHQRTSSRRAPPPAEEAPCEPKAAAKGGKAAQGRQGQAREESGHKQK